MSDIEAVTAVVQLYIDGTYEGSGDKLRDSFHENAVMNGYLNGELILGDPTPFIEQVESMPSMKEGGVEYEANISDVSVTGNVATATLKETGFAGSLTFTDYFHLIDDGNGWKIISKNFTTE